MTPQERQSVDELFDRLVELENAPRDADAERAISDGLRRAPHALYPLVQTVLVQDEALRRADARIRELTHEDQPTQGGFLDSMRAALGGRAARTSVPSVGAAPDQRAAGAMPMGNGGSFLGTAAASAAGVIGGALLLNSISSMFGHHGGSAFAALPAQDQNFADSDLARDAGIENIGKNGGSASLFGGSDDGNDSDGDFSGDVGGDAGGDFGGEL
jgi:hypothetical protein